jgi:hypothetical protein
MAFIPPNSVGSAYENFLAAFQKAAEESNRQMKSSDRPVRSRFSRVGINNATFEHCIYLERWPCRRLGADKRLDIAIKALEEFATTPDWLLIKSTVYINYLLVTDLKADLAQALHYDFDANANPIYPHPLFHMQLTWDFIPEEELRNANAAFNLELNPPASNSCWVTTRIPTPDMTFPSVLYCLVADHLEPPIFKDFASKVHPILKEKLPPPSFEAIKRSLVESPGHFKSSHWFVEVS